MSPSTSSGASLFASPTPLGPLGPLGILGTLALLVACGSSTPANTKYPPQPEGCAVEIFPDAPTTPTENIGPVEARCDESIPNDDCLRTLKDQACKLGGDVVWGVEDKPTIENGKKKFSGRAAHTKGATK